MKNESGIKPLHDKVLVYVPEVEKVTAGGIIVPDSTRDREKTAGTEATVIAIGDTAFLEYRGKNNDGILPISVGDTVCIARYAGQTHKGDDGKEYQIINEDDVTGVKI